MEASKSSSRLESWRLGASASRLNGRLRTPSGVRKGDEGLSSGPLRPAGKRQSEQAASGLRGLNHPARHAPWIARSRLDDGVEQIEGKGEHLDHGARHRRASKPELRVVERPSDGEGLRDLDELLAQRLRLEPTVHLACRKSM
jgi:hypothetical protein